MTARIRDANGYITIKSNPVSRSGIFDYMGSSIGAAEPDRMYKVYRPAEELLDPETQASFHLIPLVDDHTMLGPSADGHTPAEVKGVHGTTGTNIEFRDGVLYSDIKIFSEALADLIESGKSDLSLGYRCVYDHTPGTFAGQAYDVVQRTMRGNHLALVDEARCFVQVLDHAEKVFYGFDSVELQLSQQDKDAMIKKIDAKKKPAAKGTGADGADDTLESLSARLDAVVEAVNSLVDAANTAEDAKDKADKEAADKAGKDGIANNGGDGKKDGMDAAEVQKMQTTLDGVTAELAAFKKDGMKNLMGEITARDTLARDLSVHIGTFDASDKSLAETAKYAAEKLGLDAAEGMELAAVRGYLKAAKNPAERATTGQDAAANAPKSDQLDNYISGK